MIGIMAICFSLRELAVAFPRSVILLSALFYFIFLSIWRASLWRLSRKHHGQKKVTIIGRDLEKIIDSITHKYASLYRIENHCETYDSTCLKKIESTDMVIIDSTISSGTRDEILFLCLKHEKEAFYVPQYGDLIIKASSLFKTDDIPTFRISNMELSSEERFVKRFADILLSIIALIIALPFGLIIALLIKLDKGPVFYLQERLTENKRRFNMIKFRTMIPDAEKLSGPVLAGEKDPRITKVGAFLRMIRMDELPQLINIIKGEMSIVGPRPERPFFVEQFEKEIPEYELRYKVKAGLTGLAQVEGKYNTTVEDKLRYDLIYINNYSLWKDFLIMLQTIKILFMKESTEGVDNK
jgi:exopolysaccharide biosynthesis polyprenyl glycosylphosphotransferase